MWANKWTFYVSKLHLSSPTEIRRCSVYSWSRFVSLNSMNSDRYETLLWIAFVAAKNSIDLYEGGFCSILFHIWNTCIFRRMKDVQSTPCSTIRFPSLCIGFQLVPRNCCCHFFPCFRWKSIEFVRNNMNYDGNEVIASLNSHTLK